MIRRDEPQAFPFATPSTGISHMECGMTLRDYFAAQPIGEYNFPTMEDAAEFLGVEAPSPDDIQGAFELSAKVEAKLRYMRADAMLSERDK